MKKLLLLVCLFTCIFSIRVAAQVPDSLIKKNSIAKKKIDTSGQKKTEPFNPRKATIRSAIIPGWGQIYNKKYWKLPLVWGALGTTAGIYFYNVKNYRSLKQAYIYLTDTDPANNNLVDPTYRNLSPESIRSYRNSFRQNVDYSVLFFLLFWGLNVVDATVDAHLKAFNVTDDLSLELRPGYSPLANTSGLSLVLNIGKNNNGK
ncbi:MAG: hypothetical protein IPP72_11070 [Chitinophagaceae bacterium]|nr:hypothetical protein [Chitinophagaceae bacterium]